jgi:hypothetical protein
MTYQEASTKFGIQLKALNKMKDEGLLSRRLSNEDVQRLEFLAKIWGRDSYLKMQMAKKSTSRRKKIVDGAGLTKIENYIYTRYLNLEEGKRLPAQQVAGEVIYYFKADKINRKELHQTIERMRKKVYNLRTKERNSQKENVNIR